jgi:soluble lytic murein transglycosylase-like protein
MGQKFSFGGKCAMILVLLSGILFLLSDRANAAELPREAYVQKALLTRLAHNTWGVNAPISTFAAQIHTESRWKATATSPVGAEGLTQFMPATSKWIGGLYKAELGNVKPREPAWAIQALVLYNRWIWDRTKAANDCEHMAMTLSSYNGGLGWVYKDQAKAHAAGADKSRWFGQVERFNAGRSAAAFRENRDYPHRILNQMEPTYMAAGFGPGACHD